MAGFQPVAARIGRVSYLDVGDDDHGAQGGDEVQDADLLDVVGVLPHSGAGGVARDRPADLGIDGEDGQGAVQGMDVRFAGEVLQLFGGGVGEGDPGAAGSLSVGLSGDGRPLPGEAGEVRLTQVFPRRAVLG